MKSIATYITLLMIAFQAVKANNVAGENVGEYSDSTVSLPQISITAVKVGRQLRDKALSSTIISASDIKTNGIVNMHQISDMVPNLYIPRYGSRITSSIYVRGIGARIDQPAVGLTIDNIPILNKDNYDFDLDNMVKVDMLRGPQSTMYGRNTMCGLINITTLSPLEYNGLKMSVTGGNYGMYRANAGYYHSFNHRLGIAAGVAVNGFDGFYKNSFNGCCVGGERQWSAWYKVAWHPTTQLTIENNGRFYHTRQSGYPYESLDNHLIAYNDTCFYQRSSWLDGLTVAWRHDAWTLTSATSVQHIDDNMTLDQDFLPDSYFTLTQRRRETTITQDLILNRKGERYSWLAGVFGFTRHTTMQAPVTFLPVGIARLIEEHRNIMNPSYPIKWDEDNFILNSDFSHPTHGLGFYHTSTYAMGNFTLQGSLRLEIEQPRLRYHSHTNTRYTIYDNTVPGVSTIYRHENVNIDERGHLSHTYTQLLPRLSVLYNLPDAVGNIYTSFSKGYKPGGFNTQMFSDFLQQQLMATMGMTQLYDADKIISYKPEKSYNYEIGTHLNLLNGLLRLDASVFYISCRDQQLTRFPSGTTTGRIMDNAGHTRSIGSELSVNYRPNSHWIINASWGHADARFIDYNDGINDYVHKHVPYAPLNTMYASIGYRVAFPAAKIDNLELSGGVRGTGCIYWDETNSSRQPFYAPLHLTASVASGMFTLRLWADNINNVKYSTFQFKSMGNRFEQRGAPFTCGATLSVDIDMTR